MTGQEPSSRSDQGQNRKVAVPPGFERDILKVRQLENQCQKDPKSLSLLIQVYKQIINRLHPDENLAFYALTQNNLGNAYRRLPTGNRGSNLTQAIQCYQQALRFFTSETDPLGYAKIQDNLGDVYGDLPTGDRASNLAQAIRCYQQALRFCTSEVDPSGYAEIQNNLGVTYGDLPTGDRGSNLAQAIRCYQQALRFWTPEANSFNYAAAHNNLGEAYRRLPTGDKGRNLAQAIEHYQQALRFWTPGTDSLAYALVQNNLGISYSDLPTGDRATNLAQAIKCYQEALRFHTPEVAPLDYAKTQYNLGATYADLLTGSRASNLTQAIQCYQRALRFFTLEANPLEYAATQNNLGIAYADLPIGNRVGNLTQAIKCYQEALRFRTPEKVPLDYARTQTNLGTAYCNLPTGDRASNVAQAIKCYQEALCFRTPKTAPLDYALTQTNLGNAYRDLPIGDRGSNLAQAIECYQEALRFYTPEAAPLGYATAQTNLGTVYCNLPTGNHASNLAQAIECHRQALRFRTPETAPLDYAATQNNLGIAYRELLTGDRAGNLAQAIKCYQEALRFYTPEAAPLDYAMIQTNLGNVYNELLTGDRASNLAQAVECYQEALRFYTSEADPVKYAGIQNNLSMIYQELLVGEQGVAVPPGFENDARKMQQLEERSQRDPQAYVPLIQMYRQVIKRLQPDENPRFPMFYSSIQNDMGVAYRKLPTRDRATSLTQAIECFQQALHFYTPETAPRAYAGVQSNLGNVYCELPIKDRGSNLEQAIRYYQEALRFRTPECNPLEYAETQTNLGNAYYGLPIGDRTSNMKRAIECFKEALLILEAPEAAPLKHVYAMLQNNLGVVYTDLPTGNRAENRAQAIECFKRALDIRTIKTDPQKYAETQMNLGRVYHKQGIAYSNLSTEYRVTNLTQAIRCYEEALRTWTAKTDPTKYAEIQNNLGNVYEDLPVDKGSNLEQAIRCYQQALRFLTPEADPVKYARIQNNLGIAYNRLPTGNPANNRAQAIQCYQQALRFLSPEVEPFAYRMAIRNLADLHFAQGAWDVAFRIYRDAMKVGVRLYHVGLSAESKAAEMFENTAFYPNAAFAAARCGEAAEALLILEQGKTRLLTETLRLRVRRPPHVPDEIWNTFQLAGKVAHDRQTEKAFMDTEVRDPIQAYESHVQAVQTANATLNAAIEQVRAYAPRFLKPMDLSTIEAQLSDIHTALIAFCVTEQGSMGFVVSQHDEEKIRVVEVPSFTKTDLYRLLWDADEQPIGGWITDYDHYLTDRTDTHMATWRTTITRVLATLGEGLLTPIVSTLPTAIERIILLPSADLFLLPLHAVPLSANNPTLLCDRYEVSYTPSLEVRAHAQAKVTQGVVPALYAVINPDENASLPFAPTEGTAIAQFFTQPAVDTGQVGTKERVLAGMRGQTYIHFACHGSYDWDDPPASGLRLSGEVLTLADLRQSNMDLSAARLVTLSACETGMTDVARGSAAEYVGIPAGFLLAGVPCVIGSLWAVPDISTAMLMERFYRNHLQGKMTISAALREAQRWVRDLGAEDVAVYAVRCYRQASKGDKNRQRLYAQMDRYRSLADQNPNWHPFAHPYYWAAFTVNGM